ncbi:MAG: Crp/Fnr family transcriptional regulator [Clostridia bacterium]|nr:Crp/Fnr family transcriptional regulator [Clostridia bacterium]
MTASEALTACLLFKDINENIINKIVSDPRTRWQRLEAGESLQTAESKAEPTLTVLAEGTLSVCREKVLLNEIKAPGIVGAAALFGDEKNYQTTVVAKKAVQVLVLTQKQVEELIAEDKSFALSYVKFLSDRIRFLNSRIASFTAGSAEAKLAGYLIKNSTDGVCRISRTRLASELDMGRASLYRAIDSLVEKKLIATDGKNISVLDKDGLKAFKRSAD